MLWNSQCSNCRGTEATRGNRICGTDAFAKGCFCWVSVTIDIVIGGRADAADVSTVSGLDGEMPPSGGGFLVTLHNIEDQG